MKVLIKVVLVLVLLVIIGAVVGVMYIDGIAKSAVEKGATNALGVQTTLVGADVKILSSEFTLNGLNVANPEGFDTDHFMTLDDGGVSISLASLMKDTVELPTLTLTGIDINLEKKAGKSNYNVILENMKGVETGETKPDPASRKQFIIRQIVIKDVNVHADLLPLGGQITRVDVPIDEIVLNDVGSDGSGMSLSDLSGVIMKTIFAAVISKGGALPGDIAAELGNGLAGLGDLSKFGIEIAGQALGGVTGAAGDVLKGAGDAAGGVLEGAGDVGKAVDEGVGGLLKGAGGLLGGNKDQPKEDTPE